MEVGKDLSAAEINNLRLRAAAKCVSDTNSDFADMISDSNSTMINYDRNAQDWTYTISSNTSQTHKIYVWKTTSSEVYFHIFVDDSTPKHIFLKYSKTANTDLLREVQTDGCAGGLYTSSVSSSTVTMKKDDTTFTTNNIDTKYKFFRTWTLKNNLPGFFGFMSFVLKKQFYNNSGTTISTPAAVTTTYAIKTVSEPDQSSTDYTDSVTYPNAYYCLVNDYTTQLIDITEVGDTTNSNLFCKLVTDNSGLAVGTETFALAELAAPF